MTLYDFIEMAIDTIYDCYIWDNHKEKNIFEGEICDILMNYWNTKLLRGKFQKVKSDLILIK